MRSSAPYSGRADRRRMMRDPLRVEKMLAVKQGIPEYNKLICYGRVILFELSEIQFLIQGLPYYPGHLRKARKEELMKLWTEETEKLEVVQLRLKELEDEEAKRQEKEKLSITNDKD